MKDAPDQGAAQQIKAIIERIEGWRAERADITKLIRDEIKHAKSQGFDPPTIATVIRRREMEPDTVIEADQLLETYEAALGCGAHAGGVLEMKRNAEGVFEAKIVAAPPDAAEKLTRSQKARRDQMALAEMSRRARES